MLTTGEIKKEISTAERGSNLYGLVEMTAYYLHLRNPFNNPETNWSNAQTRILLWTESSHRESLREGVSFESKITQMLNNRAYECYDTRIFFIEEGNPCNDWTYARNDLAKQILWQQAKEERAPVSKQQLTVLLDKACD